MRLLVKNTSASASSFSMTSRPVSLFRFSVMNFLPKFAKSNARFSSSDMGMLNTPACRRAGSPPNDSTFTTSAPHSASTRPVVGAAR